MKKFINVTQISTQHSKNAVEYLTIARMMTKWIEHEGDECRIQERWPQSPLTVGVLMLISACYFAKDEGKKKIEEEGNVDRCP